MNKIFVDKKTLPDYLLPVVKGNIDKGFYLPDNNFYRLLLNYPKLEYARKPYEKINGLYDFQSSCVNEMINRKRYFISLSPGLGKTVVTSTYLQHMQFDNTIIIAPKALHYVWKEHLINYLRIDPQIRPQNYRGGLAITNSQQLDKIDTTYKIDCLIVDESILFKNKQSVSFRRLKHLSNFADRIFLLSGSPYSKNIADMWAQLNILYPHIFTSYWDFAKIFCNVEIDRYGWNVGDNKRESEHLLKKALSPYVFFAHIDDYAQLPEFTEIVIQIDQSLYQDKIEKSLRGDLKFEHVNVIGTLALLTKLKQISLDPSLLGFKRLTTKLDTLIELLETCQYPVIVCSTSNVVLEWLHLQYVTSCLFTGDSSGNLDYISGRSDLMFMQLKSGKFGHSFTQTRTLIILDYTFDSDDLYQLLARVKRITSKEPCTIYHLQSGKIDKVMYKLAKERNLSIETVLKECYDY